MTAMLVGPDMDNVERPFAAIHGLGPRGADPTHISANDEGDARPGVMPGAMDAQRIMVEGCSAAAWVLGVGAGGKSEGSAGGPSRAPPVRCEQEGCSKIAAKQSLFCIAHGPARACKQGGCQATARPSGLYCGAHGGTRPPCTRRPRHMVTTGRACAPAVTTVMSSCRLERQ